MICPQMIGFSTCNLFGRWPPRLRWAPHRASRNFRLSAGPRLEDASLAHPSVRNVSKQNAAEFLDWLGASGPAGIISVPKRFSYGLNWTKMIPIWIVVQNHQSHEQNQVDCLHH